jgi:Divergent InlB B-repeat domain
VLASGSASGAVIIPPQQTLTVTLSGTGTGSVSGPGIVCPDDCSETYDQGFTTTLVATPDEGSVFIGWTGGGSAGDLVCAEGQTSPTCSVWMTFDQTAVAEFSTTS